MNNRNQWLTFLGAMLMLVDHIGAMIFPTQIWIRVIGRLSFPIFAYGIAQGVIYTSNFPKYILRLLLAAAISQPIFVLAFNYHSGNAFLPLAYGAIVLWAWRKNTVGKVCSVALLLISHFFEFSYGFYGVAMILAFGVLAEKRLQLFLAFILLQVYYFYDTAVLMQAFSIFSLPLIFREWKIQLTLPKYFFYFFYPLHLIALLLVKYIMGNIYIF